MEKRNKVKELKVLGRVISPAAMKFSLDETGTKVKKSWGELETVERSALLRSSTKNRKFRESEDMAKMEGDKRQRDN